MLESEYRSLTGNQLAVISSFHFHSAFLCFFSGGKFTECIEMSTCSTCHSATSHWKFLSCSSSASSSVGSTLCDGVMDTRRCKAGDYSLHVRQPLNLQFFFPVAPQRRFINYIHFNEYLSWYLKFVIYF